MLLNTKLLKKFPPLDLRGDNRDFEELDTITITLTTGIKDLAGINLTNPIVIQFQTGTVVYAGDSNNDKVVDERDILPIGLFWGNNGPGRIVDTSVHWSTGQPAHVIVGDSEWEPVNSLYADADGSGIIDSMEICGVADNWMKSRVKKNPIKEDFDIIAQMNQIDQSISEKLYYAVCNCPESDGREQIKEMLSPAAQTDHTNFPLNYELYQNYPNPFNPTTTISFYLPHPSQIRLNIYNISGQLVNSLVDNFFDSGNQEIVWNGTDNNGTKVASGIYFYKLYTDEISLTRRMLLLK